jgi:hypothetical protein
MGQIFVVNGPTNWWRVAALAAVPLFIYTTWRYAEAQASLNHLREHLATKSSHQPAQAPATNARPGQLPGG